jgi:hypothetical protein
MVDLQRCMGCIWNIDRFGMQGVGRNSDAGALGRVDLRGKFPVSRPKRYFYSSGFEPVGTLIGKRPAGTGVFQTSRP